MEQRSLGNSGLQIAPLVLGGNVFGWTANETVSFQVLDAFVDRGLNCIDTADIYSTWAPGHQGGESETIIGRWLKQTGKRDRMIIATKAGMEMPAGKGLSKDYLLRAAEASLTRLQTDVIDLYQSHTDDEATPLEETLGAYQQLLQEGKVRAIGASNYKGDRLRTALETSEAKNLPRYETLQPNYNLYDRQDYEAGLEAVCLEKKLGVIPYFSLASGFLTGKYRSEADLGKSARGQGVKKYLTERGLRILDALDSVSKELNATPAQVALAWLIARPSITAPIASATSVEQLNQIAGAVELKLSAEAIETLNQASA